jgi:o-succinylbenzoate synthase
MSTIHYWRYTLRSASALNAASGRRGHAGVLLRIGAGYGCLHPWPELGDLPLDDQLATLSRGGTTPLIDGATRCAEADGLARLAGRSLFCGPIPESHWLALPGDSPEAVKAAGFDRVKLKIGRDPASELDQAQLWGGAGFCLRLDANESLDEAAFLAFWKALGPMRDQVELVEDVIPWEVAAWERLRKTGVPLAVDREAESRFVAGDIAVIKPALSSWIPPDAGRYLVTSYLDHAIGQMWAAAEASRLGAGVDGARMLVCGLMTHRCFEPDPFFEHIRCEGARLMAPAGTGLGFDDLLEGLRWKRLI